MALDSLPRKAYCGGVKTIETVNGATIGKLVNRASVTERIGAVKSRRHFSRVVYIVKFPSGRVLPCETLDEARRAAAK